MEVQGVAMIKSLFFYGKLIGLFPFFYKDNKALKYAGIAYNSLISLGYTYYFILIIGYRFELRLSQETTLSILLDAFGLLFLYCSIVSAWLTLMFRQECLKNILDTFADVDLLANDARLNWSRYSFAKIRNIAIRTTTINFTYAAVFLTDHYLLTAYAKFREHEAVWILFNVPKIVIYNIFGVYIESMLILREDYRALNKAIWQTLSIGKELDHFCDVSDASAATIRRLCAFARIHERLSDILEYVTNLFGLSLIFAILAWYIHLTLDSYIVYQHLTANGTWQFNEAGSYAISLVWIATKLLGFYFLCSVSDSTAAEAKNTVIILIKLTNNGSTVRAYKDMMKKLILQFKQKNYYASLYGLFSLDCCLLKNIISSSMMFLILMLQLKDL